MVSFIIQVASSSAGRPAIESLVYVIEFDDGDPRRIQEAIEAGLR
jgi:hypothetical protein